MKNISKNFLIVLVLIFLQGFGNIFATPRDIHIERKNLDHTFTQKNLRYIDFFEVDLQSSKNKDCIFLDTSLFLSKKVQLVTVTISWQIKEKNNWVTISESIKQEEKIKQFDWTSAIEGTKKVSKIRAKLKFSVKNKKEMESVILTTKSISLK